MTLAGTRPPTVDEWEKPNLVEQCVNAIVGNDSAMVMFGVQHTDEVGKVIGEKIPYPGSSL